MKANPALLFIALFLRFYVTKENLAYLFIAVLLALSIIITKNHKTTSLINNLQSKKSNLAF